MLFVSWENYENSKREIRGLEIHVDRDVQKNVQGDGKRNEDNCLKGGAISTTTCIKVMPSLIYFFMYIKFSSRMKY